MDRFVSLTLSVITQAAFFHKERHMGPRGTRGPIFCGCGTLLVPLVGPSEVLSTLRCRVASKSVHRTATWPPDASEADKTRVLAVDGAASKKKHAGTTQIAL